MNKWAMSGQVADIILDSIKRKIAKVCGGSSRVFMSRLYVPPLGAQASSCESVSGTWKEGVGAAQAQTLSTCLRRGRHSHSALHAPPD